MFGFYRIFRGEPEVKVIIIILGQDATDTLELPGLITRLTLAPEWALSHVPSIRKEKILVESLHLQLGGHNHL